MSATAGAVSTPPTAAPAASAAAPAMTTAEQIAGIDRSPHGLMLLASIGARLARRQGAGGGR